MAPSSTDRTVQANDLAVFRNFTNADTACITDSTGRNATNTAEYNTGLNILFFADYFDGIQQIFTTFQADAMANPPQKKLTWLVSGRLPNAPASFSI